MTGELTQSPSEEGLLKEAGFRSTGSGVWVSEEAGVVRRVGYGDQSQQQLLDRLVISRDEVARKVETGEESIVSTLYLLNLMDGFQRQISTLSQLKASGATCTSGPGGANATVSVSGRSARAYLPPTGGFGPPRPGRYLRMGMAYAFSETASVSFDGDAVLGYEKGTGGVGGTSILDVNVSVPTGSSCVLYAAAWRTRIVDGCASWADAYYDGSC